MNTLKLFPPVAETEWQAGAPPHIIDASLLIDMRVCRALRCGRCRKRGLTFTPQHRGMAYRVLAVCGQCGQRETV